MENKKEGSKTRLYINIGLLLVVFVIFIFYFFPAIFKEEISVQQENSANFVRKYNSLKKINGEIFNDERFRALKNPVVLDYPKPKVGNPEPFTLK